MKETLEIEMQDYTWKIELRILIKGPFPAGTGRNGTYERYLSYWESNAHSGVMREDVFVVDKEPGFFSKLFFGDFDKQLSKAKHECYALIANYKKYPGEEPKITTINGEQ